MKKTMENDMNCNNCGKPGHQYHQCKMPITSIGIIAFRVHPETRQVYFLMIRRKDTLGYMDFIRGKFPIYHKKYILNMMTQMTVDEKNKLRHRQLLFHHPEIKEPTFPVKEKIQMLMSELSRVNSETGVLEKYDLLSLLNESDVSGGLWTEPEWGFPKGRRNTQEKDYDCALREFSEETGYSVSVLRNIRNVVPFEEIFIGSNYKAYRHKYYLMNISYKDSLGDKPFQRSEVSGMEWKTFDECMKSIRSYNLEKKRLLTNIYNCLLKTRISYVGESISDTDCVV